MLSQRTFDIIQYIAQNVRNSDYAFGGLQTVAFGDFLQLPPVRNAMDHGKYTFESALLDLTFPHQVILEESFQAKEKKELVNLLHETSRGYCNQQSVTLIKSLSRPLVATDLSHDYVPKVSPLNVDVDYANIVYIG